jgi:predicted hydrolase (HD superfamily)
MRPEKLVSMQASSLNKKFKDKSFAAGVHRGYIDDIAKAGIERSEFFTIAIAAIQPIAGEIGLR